MKCKVCGTEHRGIPKHGGYCLDHQENRAEASEARAAQAEQERNELLAKLEQEQMLIAELETTQHDPRVPIEIRDPRWSNDGT